MPIVYVIARTTNNGRDLMFRMFTELHVHTPWQTLPDEGKYITGNPHLVYDQAIKSLLGLNHMQCHIAVFTLASGDDNWFEEEANGGK